ncbi:aminopeptidase P family protein [bacterium]|nr:MAG: aminopeptidase P family protein [bacterium]
MSELSSYHENGLKKARETGLELGLDALLVSDLPNVRRLCGFTGSNGLLLIDAGEAVLFTDSRYTLQAGEETHGVTVAEEKDLLLAALARAKTLGAKRIGFEGDDLTFGSWLRLSESGGGLELVDLKSRISLIRAVKSPFELEKMREASALSEEAFLATTPLLRPGKSEREAARSYLMEVVKRGAAPAFDTIVAGGPRGALPHAKPGERTFENGDLVVFDFGVLLDGFCSDETVTACIGKIEGEARLVYETVAKAQIGALNSIRAGISLADIDKAARATIEEAGYGGFFGHGTGHGIGFMVHETPSVSPRSEGVAEAGMTFTVEPGVYLPGRFGVRLEDTIVVTQDGFDYITRLSKEPGAYS